MDRRQPVASPNPQDKRDLERYVKFFTQKAVQLVVQSRKGGKQRTTSKPNSTGEDWFNIVVVDDTKLNVETKDFLLRCPLAVGTQPLCVEISLQTGERQSLVLENWTIILRKRSERNVGHPSVVYSRLGLLLRSILSVSRTLPAYRMARKQMDGMTLAYRLHSETSGRASLGEGYRSLSLGAVSSVIGSLSVVIDYRTSMVLSSSSVRSNATHNPTTSVPESPALPQHDPEVWRNTGPERHVRQPVGEDKVDGGRHRVSLGKLLQPWQATSGNVVRQDSNSSQYEDIPFSALLTHAAQLQETSTNNDTIDHHLSRQPSVDEPNTTQSTPMTTSADDFVVVHLAQIATPFASATSSSVLELYRHCQAVSQLPVFQEKKARQIGKVTLLADLAKMEEESDELDHFLDIL
ncbi:autophagy-related protein 13-like isoform X2 [Corticium candelabrum]|uniref:autophagy-related protein 13-like isoform X2 n=1 Tax=Corticium candelabrum TaxID=121492 RepID=UPI002E2652A4|nr:autophagy-related protein 13-like isoform X2 [Corticium candelabrum]